MRDFEAAKLLSTPKDELDKPPVDGSDDVQEALVKQEAPLKSNNSKQETLESDTEAEKSLIKVKVDGEEVEVDFEELKKGYSRESHYQKKAKDLAKDREAIEANKAKLDEMLSDAELLVNDKRKRLNSDELKALRNDDPEEYLREVEKLEKEIDKFESLKSKRQLELKEKEQKLLAKEREALFEAFPHWKGDDEAMQKEASVMFKALKEIGFNDSELDTLTDSRLFIIASKLVKLNEIEGVSLSEKEVRNKPKHLQPNANQKTDPKSNAKKQSFERFKKSGRWQDAVDYLSI